MNFKHKAQTLILLLSLAALAIQSCALATPTPEKTELAQSTPVPGDIPTWTPRPQDPTELPTATLPAPVISTPSATPTPVEVTQRVPTPKAVSVEIVGGNLFAHRGPSLYHNFVGVLYDGEVVTATGRDRISRWLRVEIPSSPGVEGWITTETQYTQVSGDIANLPFIETEPAVPAFIRNCTKTTIVIYPEEVHLLDKYNKPYNEEQFIVGRHQVLDLDIPGTAWLEDVELSEGKTVDIRYDGAGNKSKCE